MRIVTGDVLQLSYVLQIAGIRANRRPSFRRLTERPCWRSSGGTAAQSVIAHLNDLPPQPGYVSANFSAVGSPRRLFFSRRNAGRIDAIRNRIACWKRRGLLTETEEAYLIASLLNAADQVANTAGTYYAHLKRLTRKARNPLHLAVPAIVGNGHKNQCYRADAEHTAKSNVDVLYLDPPYNERDYSGYYHLPETLAWWDHPPSFGKSGTPRRTPNLTSNFYTAGTAYASLQKIVRAANARHILFHYSPEGLISHSEIMTCLRSVGRARFQDFAVRAYATQPLLDNKRAWHRVYWCDIEGARAQA
jgi:adenine-specific DNA-methyltransferase